jgi:hypothetical protein
MAAAYYSALSQGSSSLGSPYEYETTSTITIPSGGLIYVMVAHSGETVGACTGVQWDYAGVNESFESAATDPGTLFTYYRSSLWVLKTPTPKTAKIRATLSGSGNQECLICAWVGTGIDTTTPNGTIGTGTGASGGPVTATANTTSGQLVVGFGQGCMAAGGHVIYGANGNERANAGTLPTEYDLAACQDISSSGSSQAISWSNIDGGQQGWYAWAIPLNAATGGGIGLDTSGPAYTDMVVDSTGKFYNPATTDSFTPPVDSVIVVAVAYDTAAGFNPTPTISNTGFTASTWGSPAVERGDAEGTAGYVAIWTAKVTASASGTITCTKSGDSFGGVDPNSTRGRMWVTVWTGCDTTDWLGAVGENTVSTGNATTPTVLTTTAAGSRVVGAFGDWAAIGAGVAPDSSDVAVDPFCLSGLYAGAFIYKAVNTSSSGTGVTLNYDAYGTDTALDMNWCAIELLAAVEAGPTFDVAWAFAANQGVM